MKRCKKTISLILVIIISISVLSPTRLLLAEEIKDESLVLDGAMLSVSNDITISFILKKAPFVSAGYTSPYLKVKTGEKSVNIQGEETAIEGVECYVFSFKNIAPHMMNDNIYTTLRATKGEEIYYGETKEYSVASYIYSQLNNTNDAYLKTLLVDMLNYGAAAQVYQNHNKENLVNSKLTAEQINYGTKELRALTTVKDVTSVGTNDTAKWKGMGLHIANKVNIMGYFSIESINGVYVNITDAKGNQIGKITEKEISKVQVSGESFYSFVFYGLNVSQMSDAVYFTICNSDNEKISGTYVYSIESYVYTAKDDTNKDLAALVIAMIKYGDAAKAYLDSSNTVPETPALKGLLPVTTIETGKNYVIVNKKTGKVLTNTIESGAHWYASLGEKQHILLGDEPEFNSDKWSFESFGDGYAIVHPQGEGYVVPNTVAIGVQSTLKWTTPVYVVYDETEQAFQIYRTESNNSGQYKLVVCNDLNGNYTYVIGCHNNEFDDYSYWEIYMVDPMYIEPSTFSEIYNAGFHVAEEKQLNLLERYASEMKDSTVNSKSEYTTKSGATVYYFSQNGNDRNSGKTKSAPKKTLSALSSLQLKSGDVVLFERGSLFRGTIAAQSGVTYSAYGEGAKPIICGSLLNYANESYWTQTQYKNVYVCTKSINNAGNMIFDNSWVLGDYTQTLGTLKVVNLDGFTGVKDLKNDLEFHCDISNKKLYLYSSEGNPGKRFSTIDICEEGDLFDVTNKKNIIVDNIHFTLGGTHGVGAVNANQLTVRNCIFNWIGGAVQHGTTRYGNAVESYVASNGFYVYNNWIYQIYDTGITTQFGEDTQNKENIMQNNEYYDNLIEYTFWAFEYFHKPANGVVRITRDIYVHDNFCRMSGKGWGRPGAGHMCCFAPSGEDISNVVIEHNIFDRGFAFLVSTYSADASELNYNENVYVQEKGELLAFINSTTHYMDDNAYKTVSDLVGDEACCVIGVNW